MSPKRLSHSPWHMKLFCGASFPTHVEKRHVILQQSIDGFADDPRDGYTVLLRQFAKSAMLFVRQTDGNAV